MVHTSYPFVRFIMQNKQKRKEKKNNVTDSCMFNKNCHKLS